MRRVALLAFALPLALSAAFSDSSALARGFGGGGGFRGGGGGFRGGGEFRSSDFGDRGNGGGGAYRDAGLDRASAFSRPYGGDSRPDAFSNGLADWRGPETSARPSDQELQSAANRDWGGGSGDQRSLATDGGFGRALNTAQARDLQPTGHHTNPVSNGSLAGRGSAVRNAFHNRDTFDNNWWHNHPNAWHNGWWGDRWAWGWNNWDAMSGFWGVPIAMAPVDYDYGDNICYDGDNVDYGSQPVATAAQYYDQAETLAQSIPDQPSEEANKPDNWKSFGVFSLCQGAQTDSTMMFQLATNKEGEIKGNYYNSLTGEVMPVHGAVDKKSMRAAWTVGKSKDVVYDTGVSNLLHAQSPILVHFGKARTEQWTLVRLEQAKGSSAS